MKPETSLPQDEIIRSRARESFEKSIASLDQATGNRLRLMRREALSGAGRRSTVWGLPLAAAAVAVLAVSLAWRQGPVSAESLPAATGSVDEVSATGFPTEEDADLYAWLAEAPVAPARGGAL